MRHRRRRLQRQRRKFEEAFQSDKYPALKMLGIVAGMRSPDPKIPGQPRRYR